MRPLWLELLLTPMAAPESRALRRLRRIWQGLCLTLAGCVAAFPSLRAFLGPRAAVGVALILVAAIGVGTIYWTRKQSADREHLDASRGSGK